MFTRSTSSARGFRLVHRQARRQSRQRRQRPYRVADDEGPTSVSWEPSLPNYNFSALSLFYVNSIGVPPSSSSGPASPEFYSSADEEVEVIDLTSDDVDVELKCNEVIDLTMPSPVVVPASPETVPASPETVPASPELIPSCPEFPCDTHFTLTLPDYNERSVYSPVRRRLNFAAAGDDVTQDYDGSTTEEYDGSTTEEYDGEQDSYTSHSDDEEVFATSRASPRTPDKVFDVGY
jgi:hypothetical protein